MNLGQGNPANEKIRELIEYLHSLRQLPIPKKLPEGAGITEVINELIDRATRQFEMIVPEEPVDTPTGFGDSPMAMLEESLLPEMEVQPALPEETEYVLPDDNNLGDVRVGRVVSNDGSGVYTLAEQMRNPDLSSPAWVDALYDVTGDGGPVSPNGQYRAAGTEAGKTYFIGVDVGFELWWITVSTQWTIALDHNNLTPHHWDIVNPTPPGTYTRGGTYTGSPVVALSTVTARDIQENPNGVAERYVLFWEQPDSNGNLEFVCFIPGGIVSNPQVMLPADFETEAAQSDSWDRSNPTAGKDGMEIRIQTREAYKHDGDEKWYAHYRTFTFDSEGALATTSVETRVEVDVPEAC